MTDRKGVDLDRGGNYNQDMKKNIFSIKVGKGDAVITYILIVS